MLKVNRPTALACLSSSIDIDTIVDTASTMLVPTRTASMDDIMFADLQVAVRNGNLRKSVKPTSNLDGCQTSDI